MKKIFILLFLSLCYFGNAQFSQNNFIYTSFGGSSVGNYEGPDISLNYVYKQKYTFELGYSALFRKSPNEPADYEPWLDLVIFFPEEGTAYDKVESAKFLAGVLVKTDVKWLRFIPKAGITYSRITQVTNWEKKSRAFIFSSYDYYEYDLETRERLGLIIEPSLEVVINRWFGFSVSPFLLFNDVSSAYGCNFKLMVGLLRERRDPKHTHH